MHKDFTAILDYDENFEERVKELMLKNKFEQIPVITSEGIIKDVILWTDIFGKKDFRYLRKKGKSSCYYGRWKGHATRSIHKGFAQTAYSYKQ